MAKISEETGPNGFELVEPSSESDWECYFDLRWRILRSPWEQPRGSERDNLDPRSFHLLIRDSSGQPVAVGRLHFNSCAEAQVRYMAVDELRRGQGFGARILKGLEMRAQAHGAAHVILNAREEALGFYQKHGYAVESEAATMFGTVRHWRMRKELGECVH
jgi:predicted GNAT family N-acyltransferase